MYPFDSTKDWFISNRFKHAHQIGSIANLQGRRQEVLDDRLDDMAWWLKARLIVFVLLILGTLVTAVSLLIDALQRADAAGLAEAAEGLHDVLGWLAGVAGSLSGVLAAGWLFINRILGQFEVDVLGLLTGAPGTNPPK